MDYLLKIALSLLLTSLNPLSWTVPVVAAEVETFQAPTTAVPPTFFGLHLHRTPPTIPWPTIPFTTWRLWDAGVAWPDLEPQPGQWNFATLDKLVDLAEKHNVEVLLPLGLSPAWASARPDEPSAYSPGFAAEPRNLEDWRTYVRAIATRYRGRIHYYEIWNEPNLENFYTGSVEQMVTLAREAYQILKEVDPNIQVVSPSAVGSYGLPWLEAYLSQGGGTYADVMGYHLYVIPQSPEVMVKGVERVQQLLAKHNLDHKPLWNTEAGWIIENRHNPVDPTAVNYPPETKVLTLPEASAYVARALILNWAQGVERFYWYAWDNTVMGLTEADGKTLKPPAIAYAEVHKWLVGTKLTHCHHQNHTWICALQRDTPYQGWIVWNTEGNTTFNVPKDWRIQRIRDLSGNVRITFPPPSVEIGPAPLLLERLTR